MRFDSAETSAPETAARASSRISAFLPSLVFPSMAMLFAFAFYAIDLSDGASFDSDLYRFVGANFFRGDGLTDLDGTFFSAHGPIFPLTITVLSRIGGQPAMEIATVICTWIAMVIACYLSFALRGQRAAIISGLIIVFVPIFWTELTKLAIDQVQIALVMLFVLVLGRNQRNRFILAGVLLGLILLTKETAALLVLAPLAYATSTSRKEFRTNYLFFLLAVVVSAGWWWLVVWNNEQAIFPFQQLAKADGNTSLNLPTYLLFPLFLAAWFAFGWYFRKDARARLILFSGLAILPPTLLCLFQRMDERQFILFFLFSSIMVGALLVEMLGNQRSLMAAALMLPVVLLFPTSLSSGVRRTVSREDLKAAGVYLRERIRDTGQREVIANLDRGYVGNLRTVALYSEIGQYPRPFDLDRCPPCNRNWLERSGFVQRVRGPESTLFLRRAKQLTRVLESVPGFSLYWKTPDNQLSIFTIDSDELPSESKLEKIILGRLEESG